VRLAIALLCLAPTVPMLFMGEEYGATTPFLFFTSHPEAALADSVREGRRTEFAQFTAFERDEVPDPQHPHTFAASVLNRDDAASPAGQARRRLWTDALRLRRTTAALATGDRTLVHVLVARERRMAVLRDDPAGTAPVLIVANADDDDATIDLDVSGDWQTRWASTAERYGGAGAPVRLSTTPLRCTLPPWCVAVLEPATGP
jgi:maltooligosyltrehalose trehalohydrolase